MQDMPQAETYTLKEERFCLAMANGADKYKALEIAGYECKTKGSRAVQATRLLRQDKIQNRICQLQTEIMLAKGITNDRIIGNIAEIAFEKANAKPDRNRALELLCRSRGMLTDVHEDRTKEAPTLTAEEIAQARLITKNLKRNTA